jgi:uroporphyrinogen III methyltransferase/synthase
MSPTRKTTSTAAAATAKPAAKATTKAAPTKGAASKAAPAAPAGRATGNVAFVGTGPGDPGVLTVRALVVIRVA